MATATTCLASSTGKEFSNRAKCGRGPRSRAPLTSPDVHAAHRTRLLAVVLLAFAVLASGCSAGSGSSDGASRPSGAGSSTRTSEGKPQPQPKPKPKPKFVPYATPPGTKVAVRPDGFVVTKTPAGQKPPQFVVVSFDGAGWHKKWQFWRDLQAQVPFHFTGFLSGTYLLSEATKDHYVGPGHAPGKSSLAWTQPEDVPVVIGDVNEALSRGDEIGTHFNGHFCSGAEPSAGKWSTADWNNELDQFFSLIQNVDANNGIKDKLDLKASDIIGARTPCLEGDPNAMAPAYTAHHMVYDSSATRKGLFWPVQSPTQHLWQIGMAHFPMHGPDKRPLITMDYRLEYGSDRLEVQASAIRPGERVLLVDDVLATGGTLAAGLALLEKLSSDVVGASVVIELDALRGRERWQRDVPLVSLLNY